MGRLPKGSVEATAFLEQLVGTTTFGKMLRSIRSGEELSLAAFAKRLGISRTNLSDRLLSQAGMKSVAGEHRRTHHDLRKTATGARFAIYTVIELRLAVRPRAP